MKATVKHLEVQSKPISTLPFAVIFDFKIGDVVITPEFKGWDVTSENILRMLKGTGCFKIIGAILDTNVKEGDKIKVKIRKRKDVEEFPYYANIAELI